MKEVEVCLPDRQLSFCGGEKLSEEPVVSPQTCKNHCFHVPESLAGPSDRGRMIEGHRVNRMDGWGELVRGNPREEIKGTIQILVTLLCSVAGSANQPPAVSSMPKPRGRGENPAIHTNHKGFFCLLK